MACKTSPFVHAFFLLVMLLHTTQSKLTAHTFKFIQHLQQCHKGQTVDGLQELKRYLTRLGYLNYDLPSNSVHNHAIDDEFDDYLESAIKAYQVNYHLNVTGSLDTNTVHQMVKPRCGVADVINWTNSMPHRNSKSIHGVSHYEFFPGNLKWPPQKTHLTYRIHSSVKVPGTKNIRPICSKAFQRWGEVSHFTFEEVANNTVADIEIGFYRGDHGDNAPFDGPNGTLAHATAPTGGRLHYDADENWSSNPGPNEVDLESVAVHEIGHLLGLQHSYVPDAVMFAYIDSGITKRNLHWDDVQGIRTLYGLQ